MITCLTALQSAEPVAYRSSYPPDEIAYLKDEVADLRYQQALDRQRIASLELYLNAKSNGRRDFDLLALELLKELARTTRPMDYRAIKHFFHFHSDQEAYRLMNLTAKKYPTDCKLIHTSNKNRNTAIVYTP